ncbi:VOC family protein [Proteiniclasticum sp. BAD-10]|uniref:VOC family protein n=1 Tax=Proteiniclasticum sediminis TaxID=2804028 RepID=A0A941CQF8_9CLOT|nr:VOC family protein [Proteiniclasticum sediminis]MBR0576995.1 VOC family protein [Proteiniclasticum sediminis]
MKIEHVAMWTELLEEMRDFYTMFFEGEAGPKYENPAKGFESYFLRFSSGARLELMRSQNMREGVMDEHYVQIGLAHLAFSVGSEEKVRELTEKIRQAGHEVVSEPRTTGDGYYESCILDPEGNRIEITV